MIYDGFLVEIFVQILCFDLFSLYCQPKEIEDDMTIIIAGAICQILLALAQYSKIMA